MSEPDDISPMPLGVGTDCISWPSQPFMDAALPIVPPYSVAGRGAGPGPLLSVSKDPKKPFEPSWENEEYFHVKMPFMENSQAKAFPSDPEKMIRITHEITARDRVLFMIASKPYH